MLPLRWNLHPELVVLPTAGDGSCALHAVVQGFHPAYQAGRNPDGTPVNRSLFIREFRNELAEMLNKPVTSSSDATTATTWYDTLSRGKLGEFAEAIKDAREVHDLPDLTKEGFAKHLLSDEWLGQEIVEYLSNCLGVGIFVLLEDPSGITRGLYSMGKEKMLYFGNHRVAVIIVSHANKHFSTVGRKEKDGAVRTCFQMDDPLIREFLLQME
jgi:hypothetical protein